MCRDEEGFDYPEANHACLECGKCETVCPLINRPTSNCLQARQHAVAAVTKDQATWEASSSGGAFTEICKAFGDQKTAVFGAAFDHMMVRHSCVTGAQYIAPLRKSKYVQSDIGASYREVRDLLKANRHVIFSGTPCHIAGLRNYLEVDYERLLCVDFICHGVGSAGVFHNFIESLEKQYHSRMLSYTFRVKKVIWGNYASYVSRYEFENGKTILREKDAYNRLFLQQLCLRPSCGEDCRFRTSDRLSDLTIGDFKQRGKVFPHLSNYRNYSTVVVNTAKGEDIFRILYNTMDIYDCSLDCVKKYNPLFSRTTPGNNRRKEFFDQYSEGGDIQDLADEYGAAEHQTSRKFAQLKNLIPYHLKRLMRPFRAKRLNRQP